MQKESIREPIQEHPSNHLVVLCHGILGYSLDLKYFADGLEKRGFVVLRSKSNELYKSLDGLEAMAKNVKEEVMIALEQNPQLKRVSFIGNSLGGLIVRSVIKHLFNRDNGTFAGLHPGFVLIAVSPHLGVLHYTLLEESNFYPLSYEWRWWIGGLLQQTGKELVLNDHAEIENTLLYQMATNEAYLTPLRLFRHKRIYANIVNDSVVPLGTGAILDDEEVDHYRRRISANTPAGVHSVLASHCEDHTHHTFHPQHALRFAHATLLTSMMEGLNSVHWEKHLVYFPPNSLPFPFAPSAHNRVLAVTKCHQPVDGWLGFSQGQFLVDGMLSWIAAIDYSLLEEDAVCCML